MSRVHVSSRSGGWRIDGSAGPQPKWGGREGGTSRRIEKKGGGGREEERLNAESRQAGSWLVQPAREGQSFILQGRTLSEKQGGGGWVLC